MMSDGDGDEAQEACRACANFFADKSDFVAIFDDSGLEIVEFIRNELIAWQLNIIANDGLPQRICGNCFTRFCGIYSFRQECVEAQRQFWQSFLQDCRDVDGGLVEEGEEASLKFHLTDGLGLLNSDDFLLPTGEAMEAAAEEVVDGQFESIARVRDTSVFAYNNVFHNHFSNDDFPNEALMSSDSATESLMSIKPADVHDIVPTVPPQNLDTFQASSHCHIHIKPTVTNDEMTDLEEMLEGSIIPTIPLKEKTKFTQITIATTTTPHKVPNNQFDPPSHSARERELSRKALRKSKDSKSVSSVSDEELEDLDQDVNVRLKVPLSCQYCNCSHLDESKRVTFKDVSELSQHYFDAHDPKLPYTCVICSAVFQTANRRNNHVRDQHVVNMSSEVCVYCKKKLRSPMEVHQYTCAYVDDWECEACGKKFFNAPLHRFRVHQRHHDPIKQLRCKTCARVFVRRANLEVHEREHVKLANGPLLNCDECSSIFTNDYELKRHKYQMHQGEPPVRCTYCKKSFVSYAFLNRHVQNFHSHEIDGNLPLSCSNCGMQFSSVNKLRNHLQRRDENGKCRVEVPKERRQRVMNHPCPHCARRFHLPSQLERHLLTHDPQQRPVQCSQCHVRCRTVNELEHHMSVTHCSSVQPFTCNVCGKRFAYKKDLHNHAVYHNELKYHCKTDGCDFVGNNEIDLSAHVWQKHVLVPCKYCGETFIGNKINEHIKLTHNHLLKSTTTAMSSIAAHKQQLNICDMDNTSPKELANDNSHTFESEQEQQQDDTDSNSMYRSISHNAMTEEDQMSQYLMGALLDPEHEIIVT